MSTLTDRLRHWHVSVADGEKQQLADDLTEAADTLDQFQAKLDAIRTYFADGRQGYYGWFDDSGYERWCAYQNIRDDIAGILR